MQSWIVPAAELEELRNKAKSLDDLQLQIADRDKYYETQAKDYEFSRLSMEEHWQAGLTDTRRTLKHEKRWLEPPRDLEAVRTFDLTRVD